MIENRCPIIPLESPTTKDIKEKENQRVIRKFINSAIYVEKEVTDMPPLRKTSPLNLANYSPSKNTGENNASSSSGSENSSDESKSSIDTLKADFSERKTPESGYGTYDQSSGHSSTSSHSGTTVKAANPQLNKNTNNELRLSLSCLHTNRTNRTSTLDPKEKQEVVQSWLAKKEQEKKRKAELEAKLLKQREEERQRMIEKERENFIRWLADKKKEEERKKIAKELELKEQELKKAEKEKRHVENEIHFNLWVRRKKKTDLERKIKEKIALLHMYEEKQRRIEESERAYQEWLENSKHRQKPVPMNKGIQSLCSSASVTYINPIPWTPNIDPNQPSK